MIHAKCGTEIPNEELFYTTDGKSAKARGYCPTCKTRGHIGVVELTEEQRNMVYHDMPSLRYFRLVKFLNSRLWVA